MPAVMVNCFTKEHISFEYIFVKANKVIESQEPQNAMLRQKSSLTTDILSFVGDLKIDYVVANGLVYL